MRIELSDKNKKVCFKELNRGDIFKFHDSYYIKSITAYQDLVGIDLSDGAQRVFENTVEVETVNCALTIN